MPYFYYQKNFAGKYVPVKAMSDPTLPKAEGVKPSSVTNIVTITDAQFASTSLSELQTLYPRSKK